MGCLVSLPQTPVPSDIEYRRLCTVAQQTLIPLKTLNTKKSYFYRDRREHLWKLRKDRHVEELREVYHNNMRAFLLPANHFLLQPMAIHKLTKTAFAIKMRHANTDLYEFMDKSFDVRDITKALRDVAEAIHWLHGRHLAHRDIKPENIVRHKGRWKLIDFDFCSPIEHFVHCGTECFACPPDVTKNWPGSLSDSSKRGDVYAFGKMILMILWAAGDAGYIKQRRVIWVMFHKSYVTSINLDIEPKWQPWLDIATICCDKIPPVEIPALPATIEHTLGTIYGGTTVASVQMVDADPVFA